MMKRIAGHSRGLVLQWGPHRFYLDTVLLSAAMGLLVLGYIMVASASLHLGEKLADDSFYFPRHQLVHIVMGLAAGLAVASQRLELWRKSYRLLFLAGLALLLLVLVPGIGKSVNGSSRWISLFVIRIQVSEVFKLIAVIYMANYIAVRADQVRNSVVGMLFPLGLLSVAGLLLLLEPDFGATAVMMATALGMLFLAGARLWLFGILMAIVGVLGGLLIAFSSYRLRRVSSFLNPWADEDNSGYQLTQALIAFGRGEWAGVGLGSSVQKLFYLPEAHTDFLFSVIGEELGLVGACSVIALFCVIVWRAFVIGRLATRLGDRFGAFLAYGVGIWFGLQAFINMGVNMGMLPTKGLTLPLMSYGGGSMLVMCAALALLFRVRSEVMESYSGAGRPRSPWVHGS